MDGAGQYADQYLLVLFCYREQIGNKKKLIKLYILAMVLNRYYGVPDTDPLLVAIGLHTHLEHTDRI